ncbi:hypothetical protein Bca52824_015895 [Brassica carinata]|uniref:Uncharacterized protein n=1 Tax=Brassica carinata TaxID=52824 RepID=A0A8X7W407_BRACI|nr:hypothetical protein Bca52824_015895 [Brassica carinata]
MRRRIRVKTWILDSGIMGIMAQKPGTKITKDDGQQEGSEQEDSATLNQLKERCLAQADDLWRKIEESEESEDQEKVGGKEAETRRKAKVGHGRYNEKRTDADATVPGIKHRCKEKTIIYGKPTPKRRGRPRRRVSDAAPKKSDCTPQASKGRGKRKCEPSQWVQTPFTKGKKRKTKA